VLSGFSGSGGLVRVAGKPAATVTRWSVRFDQAAREYIIDAGLTDMVPVYLSPAFRSEVRLKMQSLSWRWRDATVAVEGEQMTARAVSQPEVIQEGA
jgi:hypothetical protein